MGELEQQAPLKQAKTLVRQIKAPGISQARLPLELDVWKSGEVGAAGMTGGQSTPRILLPSLEGESNPIHPLGITAPRIIHGAPPGSASHKGTTYEHGKNVSAFQGVGGEYVPSTSLCHGSNSHFDDIASLFAGEEYTVCQPSLEMWVFLGPVAM